MREIKDSESRRRQGKQQPGRIHLRLWTWLRERWAGARNEPTEPSLGPPGELAALNRALWSGPSHETPRGDCQCSRGVIVLLRTEPISPQELLPQEMSNRVVITM